jgi:hypothetical protein
MNVRVISVRPFAQKGYRSNAEAFTLCSVFVDAPIDSVK